MEREKISYQKVHLLTAPGERKICREDKGGNEDEEAMDAALLALCFVLSLAPYALAVGKPLGSAEPSVLYVSESGSNDKDGTSEENATTLDHATEIANDKGGPVQIVVVGIVSVDTWTSPTVETELVGKDEDAVLNSIIMRYLRVHQYQI